MKKFLQGMIGLAALGMAAPALAADLPVNPYSKAPVMIPAWYDWSGFFVGLNGGGGSVHNCWDLTNNAGVLLSPPAILRRPRSSIRADLLVAALVAPLVSTEAGWIVCMDVPRMWLLMTF